FSLKEALTLAVLRGRFMHQAPPGGMWSLPIPEARLDTLLKETGLDSKLSLAAVNGPSACIVSGPTEHLEDFAKQMEAKGIDCIRLRVPRAGHSHMLDPILDKFEAQARKVTFHEPKIPYVSGLSGQWITVEEACDPHYWARHVRETIRFGDGLELLLKEKNAVFLQMGSDRSLSSFVNLHPDKTPSHTVINTVRHPKDEVSDVKFLLDKIGQLWGCGITIDWPAFHQGGNRRRISLPTYPFQGGTYRIEGDPLRMAAEKLTGKKPGLSSDMADWFHTPSWIRTAPTHTATTGKTDSPKHRWLVLVDNKGPASQLMQHLNLPADNLCILRPGSDFKKVSQHEFVLNPQEESHYQLLMKQLQEADAIPRRVLHLWGVTDSTHKYPDGPVNPTDSANSTRINEESRGDNLFPDNGFYSLFFLARAFGAAGLREDLSIDVITDNMQDVTGHELLCPEKAAILGPVKVIPLEYPNIKCRCIDIQLPRRDDQLYRHLVHQLSTELENETYGPLIALRGHYRWEQTFLPLRLEESTVAPPAEKIPAKSSLKDKGVYLITGGLGGIGMVLAHYLAETFQARLILTGRSPIPPREEWDAYTADHPADDPINSKIAAVRSLESMGAEVLAVSADAADKARMENVIQLSTERFGTINGIIHSAGLPDGAAIQLRTRQMTDAILAPKIQGTLVLADLLKETQLDFFLLCSSCNAVTPVFGQIAHCAANAFLDAFAHYNTAIGTYTVSINWNSWLEVGQVVEAAARQEPSHLGGGNPQMDESLDFATTDGLLSHQGVEVFARILGAGLPQVAVSREDFSAALKEFSAFTPADLMEDIPDELVIEENMQQRPDLETVYAAPTSKTETLLAHIQQQLFGYRQVGINDDFFALGGDSLKAMMVLAAIHKKIGVKIPLPELFNSPTIKMLAAYIDADTDTRDYTPIVPAETKEYYPLSSAQKRLFVLQQLDEQSTAYNVWEWMVPAHTIDISHLRHTLEQLAQRHESLRTAFTILDGEPVQRISPTPEISIHTFQVSAPAPQGEHPIVDGAIEDLLEEFVKPFDLSCLPLFRVGIINTGDGKQILVSDMHHIITDGLSHHIFMEEFSTLYAGNPLAPLALQYKDYSHWQNSPAHRETLEKQELYWLSQLDGDIPVLEIPTDFNRPAVQQFEGTTLTVALGPEETHSLKAMLEREDTTIFLGLLAVFNILAAKLGR
ncbi:MAG: KR domain-containing protein, partial [bacterium]|nr:KR domain-containing protein [bacterium]